jgi:hypothetical protein
MCFINQCCQLFFLISRPGPGEIFTVGSGIFSVTELYVLYQTMLPIIFLISRPGPGEIFTVGSGIFSVTELYLFDVVPAKMSVLPNEL